MADQALKDMAACYCSQLKSFVTCLHTNTSQLKASISQKPPAYGDLSSFLLDFNDRAAEDAAQLGLLEEMAVENVSFEELLAHCMELYKQNEAGITLLESQLEQFGYARGGETATAGEEKQCLEVSFVEDLKQRVRAKESSPRGSPVDRSREDLLAFQNPEVLSSSNSSGRSYAHFETIRTSRGRLQLGAIQSPLPSAVANSKLDSDDMAMLGESLSLEDFGISASSLASLARIDPVISGKPKTPEQKQVVVRPDEELSENGSHDMDESCSSSPASSPPHKAMIESIGGKSRSSLPSLGLVMEEEYAQLSPWLRQRVPLEELNDSIVKINDAFHIKQSQMVGGVSVDGKPLELEDSFLLSLGSNMKACLLLLVQIDRLVIVRQNGRASYRPSELAKFR